MTFFSQNGIPTNTFYYSNFNEIHHILLTEKHVVLRKNFHSLLQYYYMTKTSGHIDWYILLSVVGLMLFSVAFVYSASSSFAAAKFGSSEKLFWNHAIRVLLGLAAIVVFSRIDYHICNTVCCTVCTLCVSDTVALIAL